MEHMDMSQCNGSIPATLPVCDDITDQRGALLDDYDTAISELDAALTDAMHARLALADAEADLSLIEARAILAASGGNAETRKATVTLALADDPAWQDRSRTARTARIGITDAERRATLAKERCRLLRAALTTLSEE
jgi:hypothetical protein